MDVCLYIERRWELKWLIPIWENIGGVLTSQVLVMNMSGIAIASDTVVTVADGDKNPLRTMPNSRKVLELGGNHKILVLHSNKSHITGIPVNVLIDSWAETLKEQLGTLEEYRDSFISWIPRVSVSSDEQAGINEFLSSEFTIISNSISQHFEGLWPFEAPEKDHFVSNDAFKKKFVSRAGREVNKYLSRVLTNFPENSSLRTRAAMAIEFGGGEEILNDWFPDSTLSPRTKSRLRASLPEIIMNASLLEDVTTVAFVGYGAEDHFPHEITISIESSFYGYTRWVQENQTSAANARPAYARWWAQSSNIDSFFRGVHSDFRQHLNNFVIPETVHQVLAEKIHSYNNPHIVNEIANKIREEMFTWSDRYYSSLLFNLSTMDSVDLADAARTLLELETLGAHKNAGLATVGGEIEVATITLRDGVVWRSKLGT